jgi:tetratricopeptide (TPR) repeat protein
VLNLKGVFNRGKANLLIINLSYQFISEQNDTVLNMNQKNDNFIDKTFTILADIILKVLPATKYEKQAFSYYRSGLSAQSNGDYAEALENYYEALKLEEDPFDRSYIVYNIGLIYSNNGNFLKAIEYYEQALELNVQLPQALNNIAVIYHYQGTKASEKKEFELAQNMFDKASEYWKRAVRLAPNNYIEAQNWLKINRKIGGENNF